MAAPTNTADVKKTLANSEPSTHGPKLPTWNVRNSVAMGGKADVTRAPLNGAFLDPSRNCESNYTGSLGSIFCLVRLSVGRFDSGLQAQMSMP